MATATYDVHVDWEKGSFILGDYDITGDVYRVAWTSGRESANVLTGHATAGRCTIWLHNNDDNYSSFNTGGDHYSYIVPNRWVRIRMDSQVMWFGSVQSVTPSVTRGVGGAPIKRAKVEAVGFIGRLNESRTFLAMTENETTGNLIEDLIEAANFPAYSFTWVGDEGTVIIPRYWANNDGTTLSAIRELEATEGGFVKEHLQGPGIDFENAAYRQTNSSSNTVQETFATSPTGGEIGFTGIEQMDSMREIYNDFRCTVQGFQVEAIATLWIHEEIDAGNGVALSAGESRVYIADTKDTSTYDNETISVNAWTTPVQTTDYTANTLPDGTGTDRSSSVGIAVVKRSSSMEITVTNNHGSDVIFMTKLEARGTGVTPLNPVTMTAIDSASRNDYGHRIFRLSDEARWVKNTEEAQAWCDRMLLRYKDPHPVVRLSYLANTDSTALAAAKTLAISDRIHIVADGTVGLGFDDDFYIESISHDVAFPEGGNHRVEYYCSWTPPLTVLGGSQPAMSGALTPVGP